MSSKYFDKFLFESDPVLLDAVAAHLVELLPPPTEVLAGLELGGVPVATALSLRTGLPVAFVRKAAKTYGTAKLAEGIDLAGRRVVVIEDVVTTGGQVPSSTLAGVSHNAGPGDSSGHPISGEVGRSDHPISLGC